ncbi:MAG: hypothetical protein HY881_11190 [Deltaproteobacteria bacterium]|nr:hypothetical protein [Deltaproteobacteria bacterium]
MEFVIVHFRESRTVLIDGDEAGDAAGPTNVTLRINQGFHTFSLAGPADFAPQKQTVKIANTTEVSPQEVNFA